MGTNNPNVITGTDNNDTIKGSAFDDIIIGGKGDDKLYGAKGTNTFVFNDGDGNDTIYYQGGTDIIDLRNIENPNFYGEFENGSLKTAATKQGNDLIIKYAINIDEHTGEETCDSIRLANYFKNGQKSDIKFILKNDKSGNPIYTDLKDFVTVGIDFYEAEKGKKITGTFLNDYIDGTEFNDVIHGGAGNDDIYGGWGNDKLYGDSGNNVFAFGVTHFGEENIEFKGDGKDTIYSGKGNDLINFSGAYVQTGDTNEWGEPETREMTINDLRISAKGNSLIINYTDEDSVELANYFKLNGKHSVKEIKVYDKDGFETKKFTIEDLIEMHSNIIEGFENKKNSIKGSNLNDNIHGGRLSDTIKGGKGNDTIHGGRGNDKLYGEFGNNNFYFTTGDGNDTIYSGKGIDKIIIEDDIEKDDMILTTSKKDLIIKYSENDSITISNYLKNPTLSSVKTIQIDTETYSLSDFIAAQGLEFAQKINNSKLNIGETIEGGRLNDTLIGSKGNDTIFGGRGNDSIKGGAGDDIIYGGAGNDKLYGEAGNNKLVFQTHDGNDTVYMGKGSDILMFKENEFDRLKYEKSGNHLVIKYGEDDSVTINNYFSSKYKSVDTIASISDYNNTEKITDKISLKNDIIISKSKYYDAVEFESGYSIPADCYEGNNFNNLIVANNNKKLNYVEAGAGDDTIYCQAKKIIAKGGEGNDTYVVSSLKNSTAIYDEGGEDTIKIADKSSNVNIIFNVATDGYSLGEYNGLYILNNSNTSSLIKTRNFDKLTGFIEIDDFYESNGKLGKGAIEQIETTNGYVTCDQIDMVREQVTSWLTDNGYSSSMEVLGTADKSTVNELVSIYKQIEWEPLFET